MFYLEDETFQKWTRHFRTFYNVANFGCSNLQVEDTAFQEEHLDK